jgi:hypothetical protein
VIGVYSSENGHLQQTHSTEVDRLQQEHAVEIRRLTEENTALQANIVAIRDKAANDRQKLLADISSELRDNLEIAQAYYTGMPGNRSYIPPSTEIWKRIRNDLSTVLDRRMMIQLEAAYVRIQRWQGIAESGRVNPDIGNPEVREIATAMQGLLPQLIASLEGI